MNCKPGDLAVLVRSATVNLGRIVRCVRLATPSEMEATRFVKYPVVWVLEQELETKLGFMRALAYDADLRPIRDPGDDAKDEMLRPLPHKEIA